MARQVADGGDADAQHRLAIALSKVGGFEESTGDADKALDLFRQSLDVRLQRAKDNREDTEVISDLDYSHGEVGNLLWRMGRLKEAQSQLLRRIPLTEELLKLDSLPEKRRVDLSTLQTQLGRLASQLGELAPAREHYQRSSELLESLVKEDPKNVALQLSLASSLNRLGNASFADSDPLDAFVQQQKSLAIWKSHSDADPSNVSISNGLAEAYGEIGQLRYKTGDFKKAESEFEKSIEILESLVAANPDSTALARNLADKYQRLGNALSRNGELAPAIKQHQLSTALLRRLAESDASDNESQVNYFRGCILLANAHQANGDWPAAIEVFAAAHKPLNELLERKQNVEYAQAAKTQLASFESSAKLMPIAMGSWSELDLISAETLPVILQLRAIECARQDRHVDAAQAATRLHKLENATSTHQVNAASVLASAAKQAAKEDDRKLWNQTALDAIAKAVNQGWKDRNWLIKSEAFDELRNESEFQAILQQLSAPVSGS